MLIPVLFALIFPLSLLWAAGNDIATMVIPNRLNMILAAGFLPAALLLHLPWLDLHTHNDILTHVGIALIALIVGMTLFFFRFMGGGDVKLIAATSLWLGIEGGIALMIYTALVGGALTLGILVLRKFFWGIAHKMPKWMLQHFEPKGDIPYGIAICIGGLLAIPRSDLWDLLTASF